MSMLTSRKPPTGGRAHAAFLAFASVLTASGPALAYIGPGAGISLLGALWALGAAVLAAVSFILFWPIRRILKRRRDARRVEDGANAGVAPAEADSTPNRHPSA